MKPTPYQKRVLACVYEGGLSVSYTGTSRELWFANSLRCHVRCPSTEQARKLLATGWIVLDTDPHRSGVDASGKATAHHVARLTDAGRAALAGRDT